MPIPQSNVIFFYLFAAFFVFITMRGELPKYMGFLLSTPTPAPQAGQTTDKTGQIIIQNLPAIAAAGA
ncbi:MAG: hypothetical protein KGJ13_06675 [Patescibacteria group bacterium]|nr:hypothetical protein [Patescibacteria group bacterium]